LRFVREIAEMAQARPLIRYRAPGPLELLNASEGREAVLMLQFPRAAIARRVHEQAVAHWLEDNRTTRTLDDVQQFTYRVRVVTADRACKLDL
jgi:hypothetical protein